MGIVSVMGYVLFAFVGLCIEMVFPYFFDHFLTINC